MSQSIQHLPRHVRTAGVFEERPPRLLGPLKNRKLTSYKFHIQLHHAFLSSHGRPSASHEDAILHQPTDAAKVAQTWDRLPAWEGPSHGGSVWFGQKSRDFARAVRGECPANDSRIGSFWGCPVTAQTISEEHNMNHTQRQPIKCLLALLSALALTWTASTAPAADPAQDVDAQAVLAKAQKLFGKLPDKMPGSEQDTPARIALGKKLYFETAISINKTQSCNSCHRVDENLGGVDGLPTSKGAKGDVGGRNAPTTLNAGLHIAQFWDGRAPDLAAQAKGPVLNPIEMGMPDEQIVLARLKESDYTPLFKEAFPDSEEPITYDNYAEAVAAFERTLITRDRFDDFLGGKLKALGERPLQGLNLFIETGCAQCHAGPLLGGDRYEKMGEVNPYRDRKDLGRFEVTKKEEDKYVFKVPSLRNIAITGPYFHDGKVARLGQAVKQMAKLQVDEELTEEQTQLITAFLRTLTDKQRVPPRKPGARARNSSCHVRRDDTAAPPLASAGGGVRCFQTPTSALAEPAEPVAPRRRDRFYWSTPFMWASSCRRRCSSSDCRACTAATLTRNSSSDPIPTTADETGNPRTYCINVPGAACW